MVRLRLKELLQEKKVSMGKLSRMSDVSYSTIARIVNDERYSPTLIILERIAKALDVKVADLFEEVDS
jgi:putative transcriptional regulator